MKYKQLKRWWMILYALSVINIILSCGFSVFEMVTGKIICEMISFLCATGLVVTSCIMIYKIKQQEKDESQNRKESKKIS